MRVVATAAGYYGKILRQPGDEFIIDDDQAFSGRWMAKAGTAAAARAVVVKSTDEEGRAPRQTHRPSDIELQEKAIREAEEREKAARRDADAGYKGDDKDVSDTGDDKDVNDTGDGKDVNDTGDDKDVGDKGVGDAGDDKDVGAPAAPAPLAIRRRPRA